MHGETIKFDTVYVWPKPAYYVYCPIYLHLTV